MNHGHRSNPPRPQRASPRGCPSRARAPQCSGPSPEAPLTPWARAPLSSPPPPSSRLPQRERNVPWEGHTCGDHPSPLLDSLHSKRDTILTANSIMLSLSSCLIDSERARGGTHPTASHVWGGGGPRPSRRPCRECVPPATASAPSCPLLAPEERPPVDGLLYGDIEKEEGSCEARHHRPWRVPGAGGRARVAAL